MHPQHDQLVRDLICHAARSDQIPRDLSVIDAGWEFRGLLARVATESREADWSPEVAADDWPSPGRARAVGPHRRPRRGSALGGPRTARPASALLGWLAGHADSWEAGQLVDGVAQLAPTADDKRQAREALLWLLARQTDGWVAGLWRAGLAGLAPTAEDKRQAREALLGLLARQTDHWVAERLAGGLARLDPDGGGQAPGPRSAARAAGPPDRPPGGRTVGGRGWPGSTPTAEDKRQAREALLGLLARQTDSWVAGRLVDGAGRARSRRRRTSARPAKRCSGCWPARPVARRPNGWSAGWSSSPRRRRTSARPAKRC